MICLRLQLQMIDFLTVHWFNRFIYETFILITVRTFEKRIKNLIRPQRKFRLSYKKNVYQLIEEIQFPERGPVQSNRYTFPKLPPTPSPISKSSRDCVRSTVQLVQSSSYKFFYNFCHQKDAEQTKGERNEKDL